MQQDQAADEGQASPGPEAGGAAEPHPAVAVFVQRLRSAYETACSPGPVRLKRISEELPGSRVIAKSTLYDNLSGRRLTLPEWGWVALFIASLRRHMEDTFLDPDLIGTVPEWAERYKAAKREVKSGRQGVAVEVGAAPRQEPSGPADTDGAAPHDMAEMFDDTLLPGPPPLEPQKLSTAEWASRAYGGGVAAPAAAGADDVLGEHGRELRAAALHGDREAAARLGILLLCRNPEDRQAEAWLADAADAGDAMAQSLLAAAPFKRRELAAAFALDLALPTGSPRGDDLLVPAGTSSRAPAVYYEAAAHAGHPEAAYRLGLLKEAEGDFWNAGRWFDLAADAGHPAARQRVGRKNADPAP